MWVWRAERNRLLVSIHDYRLVASPWFLACLSCHVCRVYLFPGVALRTAFFGFDGAVHSLVEDYLTPLIPVLFPTLANTTMEILPKVMTYRAVEGANKDWPAHTDGDLATLNICLTKDFKGACLRVFDQDGSSDKRVDLQHNVAGRAIIHLGDVLHSVTPVTSGTRYTLIVKFKEPRSKVRECVCV